MPLVAFDARVLALGPSGDRTYLLDLLRHLQGLEAGPELLLCYQQLLADLDLPAPVAARRLPVRPGWLWTQAAWPWLLRRVGADVAHAQYLVPPVAPCPTVVTIHDVSFMTHPEWFPRRARAIMRALIPLSARRATRIVTGSSHAASEIVRHLGVPGRKVEVIPYAAAGRYRPQEPATAQATAACYGLTGPYVLAVGLLQPRKNLPRLLDAFAGLAPRWPDVQLAVVGRRGWRAEAIEHHVGECGLAGRVVFCGAVPDEDLPGLYSAAAMLVYPSLYEGFGLPPLEAMACGAPVIVSASSSLPEVVGEAGILVPPRDTGAIERAIERLLADPVEAAQRRAASLRQAARFSWDRCAATHAALYAALASGH